MAYENPECSVLNIVETDEGNMAYAVIEGTFFALTQEEAIEKALEQIKETAAVWQERDEQYPDIFSD